MPFSVALAVCISAAACAAPKIQFDKESLDFGKVKSGDPISVTYKVTNTGDSDLQITGVKSSCGCTKAEARKTTLAPNESTSIDAVFNSSGFGGQITKSIAITSNDPTRQSLSLSLRGEVIPLAKVTPALYSFGDKRKNAISTFMLSVAPTDPATFSIVRVEPSPHVTIKSFRKVDARSGGYWQIFAVLNTGSASGRVAEFVKIQTNADKNPTMSVMVYGNVTE